MKKYVDLHLHTDKSRSIGDSIEWSSINDAVLKLKNNDIKIASFTDHDCFSFEYYKKACNFIETNDINLILYPGFELTIRRKNGMKGHILFVFDKDQSNSDIKIENLSLLIAKHKNAKGTNLYSFIEQIKNMNFIMIPHISKSENVLYEDLIGLEKYIYHVEANENSVLYKKFCKDSNLKLNPIMFSDTHFWNKYEPNKIFIDNFIEFKDLINMKKEEM